MITTIIPTYRRPKLLRRAIMSALNQTYPHLQVCVYDNASGDETASVVAEIAKKDFRLKYFCHKKNIGAIPNFKYGIEHVETPFFSILYDDDVILPDFYQTAINGIEKFPEAIFFAGLTIYMDQNGDVKGTAPSTDYIERRYKQGDGLLELLKGNGPALTAILYRKETVKNVNSYNLNVGPGTDSDFVLRIAARYPIIISKHPSAIYMIHDLSYCASADSTGVWPYGKEIIRNIEEDKRIPKYIRLRAKHMLRGHFGRTLFDTWISDIRRKNFDDAYRIINSLKEDFNQGAKAYLMYLLTKTFEHIPITYGILNGSVRIRKFLIRNKKHGLQNQFGDYSRFLKMNPAERNAPDN